MTLTNLTINPETILRVLLHASEIPDGAAVSKRTGDKLYTLRHNVVFWDEKGVKQTVVEGFFIVDTQGNINQVKPLTMLHWNITADDLIDTLKLSWDSEQ